MKKSNFYDNVLSQGIADYTRFLKDLRLTELIKKIDDILINETNDLSELGGRSSRAFTKLDLTKMEIENLILSNRGGKSGLHGYIAEFAEEGISNSRNFMKGIEETTKLFNNNGKADLQINGENIQMKFWQNLSSVLKKSQKYRDMKMMFPKNQIEIIQKIMNGEKNIEYRGNKLTLVKIKNIENLILEETKIRGENYENWLNSSVLNYDEVQKEAISKTLDNEKKNLLIKEKIEKDVIKENSRKKRSIAYEESKPNFTEATKVAGIGAATQGFFNFMSFVYKKSKNGKKIYEFEKEDWKEAGLITGKGAIKGGVKGYSIYGLTNICKLSAPAAAAITTGTFGVVNSILKYRSNEIDTDSFLDLITLNAIDSTGVAIGATIGQAIIPVPIVGAVVGSIAFGSVLKIGEDFLNEKEKKLIESYQEKINAYINTLDKEYEKEFYRLLGEYSKLDKLQEDSFNLELNIRLKLLASIELAKENSVDNEKILANLGQIDKYFLI